MKDTSREDEWLKARRECLRRYKNTCYRCEGHNAADRNMTVHHIIPREEGGTDKQENLVALCSPCHDIVELSGARNLVEILATYEMRVVPLPTDKMGTRYRDENFVRPTWHRWVYGDHRRA